MGPGTSVLHVSMQHLSVRDASRYILWRPDAGFPPFGHDMFVESRQVLGLGCTLPLAPPLFLI